MASNALKNVTNLGGAPKGAEEGILSEAEPLEGRWILEGQKKRREGDSWSEH